MVFRVTLAVLLLGAIASPTTAPAQPTAHRAAGSLVGAWRLVSWTERLKDGTSRQNPRTVGSLMYSASGRMCGVIIDPHRPAWKGRPPDEAEIRAAFDGLVAYCGTYDLHTDEGFVVHHVDIEKSPGSVGISRKRWFEFTGLNRLSLRVDPAENGATVAESVLVWERVQ
jgi:lipocalin-like protein